MENFDDFSFDDFDNVDFDNVTFEETELKNENVDEYLKICKIEFDETTTMYYKTLRERKLNVFTQEDDIEPTKSFQYRYMWDPFVGEPTCIDPYGSLWFNPMELVKYFTEKCLNGLWHDQVDETGGVYQGYYGDLLGSGENMYVVGRGNYIELYLFRLPIIDCYVPKDCKLSLITMGAKLTISELIHIDDLIKQHYSKLYFQKYKTTPISLAKLKSHYDMAIDPTPSLEYLGITRENEKNIDLEDLKMKRTQTNMMAVENIKKLVGKKIL